jgi:DNA-binding NarL/FixJ family response regulator
MPGEDFVAEEPMECELSPRELQILRTAARAMGNKEVANTVPLSDTIIKRNTSSDYGKLDVNSRGEAASKAASEGWVSYRDLARDE